MLAVAKTRPGVGLELIQAEKPSPLSDEVVVKVKSCAICGNDVHIYNWSEHMAKVYGPLLPAIIGHEVCGEVIARGENVNNIKIGTRVSMEPIASCGNCYNCKSGRPNICSNYTMARGGGMAEYMPILAKAVIKIPDEIPDMQVPIIEVLGAGLHGLEQMPVLPGNSVALLGPGPIGLLLLQCLKAAGAWPLIVVGTSRSKKRLELARDFGADAVFMADKEDVVAKVKKLTNDRGVDQVFEAAGTGQAMLQAMAMVKAGGQICTLGATDDPVELHVFTQLRKRGINIITSMGRTAETWERAINLVQSGKVKLGPIVSEVLPLRDALKGFDLLMNNRDYIKIVLAP
ncbi:MAG: alcohol dehydrogenase catalytic domain-containing protein [Chloroflexi bacterium]|nr:alcohol dehydrogenase catalytic domain-containing protein [Chloroflexota bacterium]